MTDTVRLRAALEALFPDNTSGDISPQDLRDFLASALLEIIEYPASSVGGIRIRPTAGSGTSDIVRLGRYGGGGLIGFALGNDGHFAIFSGDYTKELYHWDSSIPGNAKGRAIGLDFIAANRYPRVEFVQDSNRKLGSYGGQAPQMIGLPRRSVDPTDLSRVTGTATAGTAGTVTTDKNWTLDQYADACIILTGGTGQGQIRKIVTNTEGPNSIADIGSQIWDTTPNATTTYEVFFVLAGDIWYDPVLNVVKYFDGTAVKTVATV